MAGSRGWLDADVPASWGALTARSVRVALVAFVVLQVKELVDAGRLDTLGTSIDGALIGVGTFLLHAVFWKPKGTPS